MDGMGSPWNRLGVVGTIYEDEREREEDSSCSSTKPQSPPSSSNPLNFIAVEEWSMLTGNETDIIIHIHDSTLHLHKSPLASKSGYLKRQLSISSEITLAPPLNITVQTFAVVVDYCYGYPLIIIPTNAAAVRMAAQFLEMFESSNNSDNESLQQKTDEYISRGITTNKEFASIVLRSCLSLLPDAETKASLVSRCIGALSLWDDGNTVMGCLDNVPHISPENFQIIVESVQRQLTGHEDILYGLVDHYLKEYSGKITDEQKTRMCSYIDCSTLSHELRKDAVLNPRMPLRFIVQVMFIEQRHTQRAISNALSTADDLTSSADKHRQQRTKDQKSTLNTLFERETALSQLSEFEVTMDARVKSLEEVLSGMRTKLSDDMRSASCRFNSENANKVVRGERGSISSGSMRYLARKDKPVVVANDPIMKALDTLSEESSHEELGTKVKKKKFGLRLMKGFKNVIWVSRKKNSDKTDSVGNGNGVVVTCDYKESVISPAVKPS